MYNFYQIDNLQAEAESWYNFLQNWDCDHTDFIDLLTNNCTIALKIFMSLPTTSCTAEHSFSTLRRVITWLWSTIDEDSLSGLFMLSVRYEKVNSMKD